MALRAKLRVGALLEVLDGEVIHQVGQLEDAHLAGILQPARDHVHRACQRVLQQQVDFLCGALETAASRHAASSAPIT